MVRDTGRMVQCCEDVCECVFKGVVEAERTYGQITAPVTAINVKTEGGSRKKPVFFLLNFFL